MVYYYIIKITPYYKVILEIEFLAFGDIFGWSLVTFGDILGSLWWPSVTENRHKREIYGQQPTTVQVMEN